MTESPFMTRKEAARFLRLSTATLSNYERRVEGPRAFRAGRGKWLYKSEDLLDWLTQLVPKPSE